VDHGGTEALHRRHARVLGPSEGLPIVIDGVDHAVRIAALLPALGAIVGDGLMTVQPVEIRLAPDRSG